MSYKTPNRPLWPAFLAAGLLLLAALVFLPVAGDALKAFMAGNTTLALSLIVAQAARASGGIVAVGMTLGLFAGGFLMVSERIRQEKTVGGWFLLAFPSLLPPLSFWVWREASSFLSFTPPSPRLLIPWAGGALAGLALAGAWLRWGVPSVDAVRHRLSKKPLTERNKKTDVREIREMLPAEIGQYNPTCHFKPRRGFFVGLDEDRRPVFVDGETWRLSHILLTGRTRAGKGVAAQVLLTQACAAGELVVVLDPKGDEWLPAVLYSACRKAGVPYTYVDLRRPEPQISLFAQATAQEIETTLIGGFSLSEKGEASDFYRLADRAAAREAAQALASGKTPAETLSALGRAWLDKAAGFHAAFVELVNMSSCSSQSFDWEGWASGGGCLYIVGDALQPAITRAQRMIALRVMLLAKRMQEEGRPARTITLFADEFRWHVSKPFMAALGMAAGWGLHCILAMQSLQDLADCPADLDKKAVRGAVMENCAIQLSYAIKDPETAEWLAKSTGKIQVDDEMRSVTRNLALAETVDPERRIRQAERYFIDENMFLMLPKSCAVLSVPGELAKFVFTSPIRVEKNAEAKAIRPQASPSRTEEPAAEEPPEESPAEEQPAKASPLKPQQQHPEEDFL